jgi:CRP/FNR family transcriptional regulator
MQCDLAFFPLFRGVAPTSLRLLARHGIERRFRTQDVLFQEGSVVQEVFAVLKGRVKVGRSLENGGVVAFDLLAPGEVLGLLGAMTHRVHRATATALSPVAALAWPARFLLDRVAEDIALSANINGLLSRRLDSMADRVEELASPSVEPRRARMLLRLGDKIGEDGDGRPVRLHLTQSDLGELARTTGPTVSRVLTRWRAERVVDAQRGVVVILDRARLAAIARDAG